MAFCAKCGGQVSGSFCTQCGATVGAVGGPAPATTPSSSGLAENIAAALSYIWPVGVAFLFIAPYNTNKTIRFHAFQSIFYTVAYIVVVFGLTLLSIAMALAGVGILGNLVWLLQLAMFALWIFLVYKAYNNEKFVLPVIGPLAEKQA